MLTSVDTPRPNWRPQALIRNFLLGFLLFFSWYSFSLTRELWDCVDLWTYRLCNGSLEGRPIWQLWWAFANTRYFDLGVLSIQLVYFMWVGPKASLRQRFAQFLFLYLFAHTAQTLAHASLERVLHVLRHSPTAALGDGVRLVHLIPWAHVKDASWQSFPGDHTVIVMLWALFCGFFKGANYRRPALLFAALVCSPRLFSGAHWLSDLVVGGGSFTLVLYAIGAYTPLHHWVLAPLIGEKEVEESLELRVSA